MRKPTHTTPVDRTRSSAIRITSYNVCYTKLLRNQFDNVANRLAHVESTGPEIWAQTDGHVDAFTCSVGTGGTLAGVSRYLKEKNPKIEIVLADPPGSALFNWVKTGEAVMSPGPSLTEGIGRNNFV